MQTITIFFLGLTACGLLMAGLSAKAMATVLTGQVPGLRRVATVAFGLAAMLLGAATAAAGLSIVLPAEWGANACRLLFIGGFGASVGLPVWWIRVKNRRAALNPVLLGASPVTMAALPAAAASQAPNETADDRRHAWPHADLTAARAAVRAARLHHAKVVSCMVLVLAAPIICLVAFKSGWTGAGIGLVVTAMIWVQAYSSVEDIGGVEYRRLPGSVDASGKHRCVYCGHRGVFRQGQYASNSTWHQCTGCRKHLFVD